LPVHGDPGDPERLSTFVEGSTRPEKALPDNALPNVESGDQGPDLLSGKLEGALLGSDFETVEQGGCWCRAGVEQGVFKGVAELIFGGQVVGVLVHVFLGVVAICRIHPA
jgi:hypothetical protein